MGLFWDLIQQGQISEQAEQASSLEKRIKEVEDDLRRTQELVLALLQRLEETVGEDIDGDGKIG